jgi:hypothetical protein
LPPEFAAREFDEVKIPPESLWSASLFAQSVEKLRKSKAKMEVLFEHTNEAIAEVTCQ